MFSEKSRQVKKGYLEFMRQQEPVEIGAFCAKNNLAWVAIEAEI